MHTALHRWALLPLLLIALCAAAAPLPEARPEAAGLSTQRLARLDELMQRAVEAGDFPGAVVMIARNGKLVYSRAFGMQDKAAGTPMALDSIFRAYSMTKPIVSVGAMILVE